MPALLLDFGLGYSDHTLYRVVVGAVAGVQDDPYLQLRGLVPHRLGSVDLIEPYASKRLKDYLCTIVSYRAWLKLILLTEYTYAV